MSTTATQPAPTTAEQVAAFIGALFLPDDVVEFRYIDRGGDPTIQRWWKASDINAAKVAELQRFNAKGRDIYAGINPRPSIGATGDDSIAVARSVFVDFDKGATVESALSKAAEFNLPAPSIILFSGHGVHLYWLLAEPITDLELWAGVQCDLIAALGTDTTIKNPERIMRVPGFVNPKKPPADAYLVECHADRVYELAEIVDRLPMREDTTEAEQVDALVAQHQAKSRASRNGSASVIDTFNANHDIETMLLGLGYTHHPRKRDWLLRPGKTDPGQNVIIRDNRSFHFSSEDQLNRQKFGAADVHDAFDVFCLTRHNGDVKAAVRAAAEVLGMTAARKPVTSTTEANEPAPAPAFIDVSELCKKNPELRRPVIYGLLRQGETANIIAPPKYGKSWLVLDLAISAALSRCWLGRYQTDTGNVLLIDNELHPSTIANRIPAVASARGIMLHELAGKVAVESFRGRLKDVYQLDTYFRAIEPGKFGLIIVDAFYRTLPRGMDENSNADMTAVYNQWDRYAEMTGSAIVLVHHASKGVQGGKAVTDVGAGAGSQSRATDCHIILRQHQEDGAVVMEAAVRSFKPVDPVCLRWAFPVFTPDESLDASQLRMEGRRKRREEDPAGEVDKPADNWTPERFAAEFVKAEPVLQALIVDRAVGTAKPKLSEREVNRLIRLARADGFCHTWTFPKSNAVHLSNRVQTVTESGGEK